MRGNIHVEIASTPIAIQTAIDKVMNAAHGAIDTFIGIVRNHQQGKSVIGVDYDVHQPLAQQSLFKICQEALTHWPKTNYYVAHYHGFLSIGGISIIIAVSASHRAASFEACRYVIEAIKKRSPIWKQEHYQDGVSHWLPGHSLNTSVETDGAVGAENGGRS